MRGKMHETDEPSPIHTKRKAATLNDLFESKRPSTMFSLKQEFNSLISKKKEFLTRQRRASLLVDPYRIGDCSMMKEFSRFYRKLSNAPMPAEDHPSQIALIEQVVKESIVVEWPRHVGGLADDVIEIDMAPLIHRARNVVKCRTSHPTMRIKVFAISEDGDDQLACPNTVEAFFRASLVKLSTEGGDPRLVAGRMILTQREGTPATKCLDQHGATVTSDGKLIASQASPDAETYVVLNQMNENGAKTTSFKYDSGILCATFPEMGVTLNSMVDRRQLATRYAIQVEVALNIDNKLIVNHTLLSHPFLIAITNDQTEPLLHSIYWNRLTDADTEYLEAPIEVPLHWSILRKSIVNFVKAQIVQARSLEPHELFHLQCMILLPRITACQSVGELTNLEMSLYGDVKCCSATSRAQDLRDRLLVEEILPDTLIERREFMTDKCISILDMTTQLAHSMWIWLFRVAEMIQDVGHRLCPSPALSDKKSTKTKKQMAASEEYQTMLSLFNKGFITLSSVHMLRSVYRDSAEAANALMVRFCDENSGYLSISYGFDSSSGELPRLGSISCDHIKDFKQGLPEVLIDEPFPAKFDRIVRLSTEEHRTDKLSVSLPKKHIVFHSYRTTRLQNDSIHVVDCDTVRVNPLTGEKMERMSPPAQSSAAILQGMLMPHLGQGPPLSPVPLMPANFMALFQQQLACLQATPNFSVPEGFDMGMFLRNRTAEENASEDRSGANSVDEVKPLSNIESALRTFMKETKG